MCDLSIITPGIRNDDWVLLYDSINKHISISSWEIIFVGPYPLPKELKDKNNIQYFKDFGAPTRCRQIGLIHAKGKWICNGSDDLLLDSNSLDVAISILQKQDYKTVLLCKYTEGKKDNPEMLSDDYWTFQYHDSTKNIQKYMPYKAWIIMPGIVSNKLLKEIGGWDCQFNICAVACLDLSLRLQNYGINLLIHNDPLFHLSHYPNTTGDHGPIANSQLHYDMPLLHHLYTNSYAPKRINISLNNWKYSPIVWLSRFKQEEQND